VHGRLCEEPYFSVDIATWCHRDRQGSRLSGRESTLAEVQAARPTLINDAEYRSPAVHLRCSSRPVIHLADDKVSKDR